MPSSALRMARASLLLRAATVMGTQSAPALMPGWSPSSTKPPKRSPSSTCRAILAHRLHHAHTQHQGTFYDSTWSWCRTVWGGAGCLSKTKQITGAEQRSPSFSLFGIISWSLWMRRRFKSACCHWNPTPQTKQRPLYMVTITTKRKPLTSHVKWIDW